MGLELVAAGARRLCAALIGAGSLARTTCLAVLLAGTPALCLALPGLLGSYFNNNSLTAPAVLVRVDSTVDFNWGNASPNSTINVDYFSARWTGFLRVQTSGNYYFQTVSDDAARLTVNGSLVINNWTSHAVTTDTSGAVALTAGVDYAVTLEMFENTGQAVMNLFWQKPGDAGFSVIPASNGSLGLSTTAGTPLLAAYDFEEASYAGTVGELKDTAGYSSGPFNGRAQGSPLPGAASASPARAGSTGTCRYASLPGPASNGGDFAASGLPVSTGSGSQTTVAFWMYWDGTDAVGIIGWNNYVLAMGASWLGFSTNNNDVNGTSNSGLANGWHHVVAVFTNGSVTSNQIYVDGVARSLAQRVGWPVRANAVVASTLNIGGYGAGTVGRFSGRIDQVRVFSGAISAAEVATLYAETRGCSSTLHHLELQHGSGTGLTCAASTVTVTACQNAACTTLDTGGVSGSLSTNGSALAVIWSSGSGFTIPAGSSSATVDLQVASAGSLLLGTTGTSTSPASATSCNFGSPACTFTAADSGFLFDVPNHRAELSNSVSVTAVRKSDNSAACTPAFANVSKALTFKCSYTNPTGGLQAVRVGGAALNSGNSATSACDGTGRAVTLSFNGSGQASTTVQYADVGQMALTATYTGSGSDAGLVMTGTDNFIAAPYDFSVTGVTSGTILAGGNFSATVTARNYAGNSVWNYGRETGGEQVTMGFARAQPTGAGASNGAFAGAVSSGLAADWASGVASGSTLTWSEVGRGDVTAVMSSGSYLGSGMTAAGSSAGAPISCANENSTCVLPTGATATVYYGALGKVAVQAGRTGSVGCNNATFGDPYPGNVKTCGYVVTSGAAPGATGAALFKPHHFDLVASPACGAFSYAAQPFNATVTARNASNATTVNYDGSGATNPNFAKATTLAEPTALGVGTLSGSSLAASAFTAGVGSASPAYTFTSKTTSTRTLALRATDADAVSSSGYAEAGMPLRSGRLRLSNAFGSASAALQLAVAADYWSGNSWVLNSADSCTTLATGNVALSNPRNAAGTASAASTSAGAVTLAAGSGLLALAAPTPAGSSLSLDLAINLGATAADQSCQANHPASTGAAKPWLRAQNGSCAATADRDPAARASFGLFSPETRKTVHVREIF